MDWLQLDNQALELLMKALITLLTAAGGALLAYWQPKLKAKYEQSVSLDTRQIIEMVVKTGVTATEQLWSRPDMQQLFGTKKTLAIHMIDQALQEHGITLTAGSIEAWIEAAVYQYTNQAKVSLTPFAGVLEETGSHTDTPTPERAGDTEPVPAPEPALSEADLEVLKQAVLSLSVLAAKVPDMPVPLP